MFLTASFSVLCLCPVLWHIEGPFRHHKQPVSDLPFPIPFDLSYKQRRHRLEKAMLPGSQLDRARSSDIGLSV